MGTSSFVLTGSITSSTPLDLASGSALLKRTPVAPVPAVDLLLALAFDHLQDPKLLLCDVRQRDGQPDALRVENAETTPHQSAVRCIHRLFEPIFRTPGFATSTWPTLIISSGPL